MANRKYNNGDYIGPNKILLKERLVIKGEKHCRGIFECSGCGELFESRIDSVVSGKVLGCGCFHNRKKRKYFSGDLIGPYQILFKDRFQRENDKTYYGIFQCPFCSKDFEAQITSIASGKQYSCGCKKTSQGEEKISILLKEYNITYVKEKTFDTCRFPSTNALARFDFWVDNKYLIEFDGIQHFQIGGWMTEEKFIDRQKKDIYKNQWCKKNNISLIRIPYTHLKDLCIEDLLLETSKFIMR